MTGNLDDLQDADSDGFSPPGACLSVVFTVMLVAALLGLGFAAGWVAAP